MVHNLINISANVALFLACGGNVALTIRAWKLGAKYSKELARLSKNYLPDMISALDECSYSTCPFCAIAAGKFEGKVEGVLSRSGEESSYTIQPEEEVDGYHPILGGPEDLPEQARRVPCQAAQVRKLVRRAFGDFMNATGAEKTKK